MGANQFCLVAVFLPTNQHGIILVKLKKRVAIFIKIRSKIKSLNI